jgi:hypothetical protein
VAPGPANRLIAVLRLGKLLRPARLPEDLRAEPRRLDALCEQNGPCES